MAQYTMELRTILYQYWLDQNPGKNVNDAFRVNPKTLCDSTWTSVFDFNFPMFAGMTQQQLCSQILMHYFMREIGLETVPLWKQFLETRMNEIMPYYVKLAESEITKAQALENKNITEKVTRTGDEDEKTTQNQTLEQTSNSSQSSTNTQSNTGNNWSLFSDTPQDGLTAITANTYLTNATNDKIDSTVTDTYSGKNDTINNGTNDQTGSRDKNYSENVSRETSGFEGDTVDTILKYRESILQIPRMIIKDLADLFIGILY